MDINDMLQTSHKGLLKLKISSESYVKSVPAKKTEGSGHRQNSTCNLKPMAMNGRSPMRHLSVRGAALYTSSLVHIRYIIIY